MEQYLNTRGDLCGVDGWPAACCDLLENAKGRRAVPLLWSRALVLLARSCLAGAVPANEA